MRQEPNMPVGGSPVVRWAHRISAAYYRAIAAMLVVAYGVIMFLTVNNAICNSKQPVFALQVMHLLVITIGFAVLLWGFWGGVVSAGAAGFVAFLVTVIVGRWSLSSGNPFERFPFFMESLLFFIVSYLCLQFVEREEVEETADRRQLERLEGEYLEMAIKYGKREDLLRVLEKKQERLGQIEAMAQRLKAATGGMEKTIQVFLNEVLEVMGKAEAEAEIVLYSGDGIVRYPRGSAPLPVGDGKDEVDQWLERHGTALLVSNLAHDVRFTHEFGRSSRIVSIVAVPLSWKGTLRGTLRLTCVHPRAFAHGDLRLASETAGLVLPLIFSGA